MASNAQKCFICIYFNLTKMKHLRKNTLGDPSTVEQIFTKVSLEIWCCRYWCLREWECNETAFPYWRIYWNKNEGGVISYQEKTIEIQKGKAYILPPHTSFRTHITGGIKKTKGMNVVGREIRHEDREYLLLDKHILHLFIHFNLGVPYDYINPDVFEIPLGKNQLMQLENLAHLLKSTSVAPKKNQEFETGHNFLIQSIILGILSDLPEKIWKTTALDNRISNVIHLIENNIDYNFTNSELAQQCHMATNSLIRLFKEEKGIAVQKYIRERKMARAHTLLEHTEHSIETIAEMMGYANRYHFSRVFRQVTTNTPAQVRKDSVLKMERSEVFV